MQYRQQTSYDHIIRPSYLKEQRPSALSSAPTLGTRNLGQGLAPGSGSYAARPLRDSFSAPTSTLVALAAFSFSILSTKGLISGSILSCCFCCGVQSLMWRRTSSEVRPVNSIRAWISTEVPAIPPPTRALVHSPATSRSCRRSVDAAQSSRSGASSPASSSPYFCSAP